jgi:hypothetical protein
MEHGARMKYVRQAQEAVWAEFFEKHTDRVVRAHFVMAFWYQCRKMTTTGGKLTDQAVFGTDMFDHALDAMQFFGIAKRPYVDDRGRVMREQNVIFHGNGHWDVSCKDCGYTVDVQLKGLVKFWNLRQTCKDCR